MSKPMVAVVLGMVFASILTMPIAAEEVKQAASPVAEIHLSPARIDWVPAVDAERWVLTIEGPRGLSIRRPFEAGKIPSLGLLLADGDRLPDGSYAWELEGILRSQGTGKLAKRPLTLAGRFSIEEGSFVAAPAGTGVEPPDALHNLTAKDIFESGKLAVHGNACIGSGCNSVSDVDPGVPLKLRSFRPSILFDDIGDAEDGIQPHDWALVTDTSLSGPAQLSIRDVESGLNPFSLTGGAPANSLFVSGNGNVGIGTATPSNSLHVQRADGTARLLVEEASGTAAYRVLATLKNRGGIEVDLNDTSAFGGTGVTWALVNSNANLILSDVGDATQEFVLSQAGNLTIAGTLTQGSSRAIKEELRPVDSRTVLRRVLDLPITSWQYKADPKVRHVGPMSEDFFAAFKVGSDDKGISVTDSAGVALAAIQGLHQELAARDAEIATLRARLEELAARLEELKKTP
jgi:endosialidase-like protein